MVNLSLRHARRCERGLTEERKEVMDLISRQAALDIVFDFAEAPHNMYQKIRDLPTIEPKNGKWIEENRRPKSSAFYCSVCHRTAYDPQNHRADVPKRCRYAYCPNCGAKMERSEE